MLKVQIKTLISILVLSFFSHLSLLQAQFLEIWEIQGEGVASPYVEQIVTSVQNIVIAVGDDRFFMQTPVSRSDDNPNTSDAIMVLTNSNPSVFVGDLISVSGRINEVDGNTQFNSLGLQIDILNVNQNLPPAVVFDETFPSAEASSPASMERVEGMRIQFDAIASGPTTGDDVAPLYTASERPFREPGLKYPGMANLPVWDGNPEVFWFDPDGLDQPNNRFIATGMNVSGEGVIVQDEDRYYILPSSYTISGDGVLSAVRNPSANELSISSLNVLMLNSNQSNFNIKLRKLSKYIIESMKAPDVVALQEVANSNSLSSLRNFILQNYGINYASYFEQSNGSINTAYLVKNTLTNVVVTQLGENETLSIGGTLHDRPPLLLTANIKNASETPISVINVHLRSLLDIDGENGSFVRTKRHEQAVSLAQMIQNRQDENLFIIGDFNAFQFTDAYVDVMNQIMGTPSLGAIFSIEDIVTPPLINYTAELEQAERYSFVFDGNAQILDHCLSVSSLSEMEVDEVQYARGNADQPQAFTNNDQVVNRSSDHDGFVVFIDLDNPITSISEPSKKDWIQIIGANPTSKGNEIIVQQQQPNKLNYQLQNVAGQILLEGQLEINEDRIQLPQQLTTGQYFLTFKSSLSTRSFPLNIVN